MYLVAATTAKPIRKRAKARDFIYNAILEVTAIYNDKNLIEHDKMICCCLQKNARKFKTFFFVNNKKRQKQKKCFLSTSLKFLSS